MPVTIARPSTIPASPEVLVRQVAELDPSLLDEITTTRRELEPLVAQILPLLRRVVPLEERCIDVAETLEPGAYEAGSAVIGDVQDVTGASELYEVFGHLAAAFPKGSGGLIDG